MSPGPGHYQMINSWEGKDKKLPKGSLSYLGKISKGPNLNVYYHWSFLLILLEYMSTKAGSPKASGRQISQCSGRNHLPYYPHTPRLPVLSAPWQTYLRTSWPGISFLAIPAWIIVFILSTSSFYPPFPHSCCRARLRCSGRKYSWRTDCSPCSAWWGEPGECWWNSHPLPSDSVCMVGSLCSLILIDTGTHSSTLFSVLYSIVFSSPPMTIFEFRHWRCTSARFWPAWPRIRYTRNRCSYKRVQSFP